MNKNSYRGHQAHHRARGGAAKASSGPYQRPGQAAAVVFEAGDGAGGVIEYIRPFYRSCYIDFAQNLGVNIL
jgi:hypothetical protein